MSKIDLICIIISAICTLAIAVSSIYAIKIYNDCSRELRKLKEGEQKELEWACLGELIGDVIQNNEDGIVVELNDKGEAWFTKLSDNVRLK